MINVSVLFRVDQKKIHIKVKLALLDNENFMYCGNIYARCCACIKYLFAGKDLHVLNIDQASIRHYFSDHIQFGNNLFQLSVAVLFSLCDTNPVSKVNI